MIVMDSVGNLMLPTNPRDRPHGVALKDWPKSKFIPLHPVIAAVRRAIRGKR